MLAFGNVEIWWAAAPARACTAVTPLRLACALLALAALSCSAEEPEQRLPPTFEEVEVLPGWYESLNLPIRLLEDGGALPLRQAPQGGHWAFVSARVRGIEGGEVEVRARLYGTDSPDPVFAERRTGLFVPSQGAPGFFEPDLDLRGAIVHVPACPVNDALPVFRRELRLVLEVTTADAERRGASAELTVTPSCAAGTAGELAVCECECAPAYDPGKCY